VASSTKNAWENLGIAMKFAQISAGEAASKGMKPMIETLTRMIELATDGGVFSTMGQSLMDIVNLGGKGAPIEEVFKNVAAAIQTSLDLGREFMEILAGIFDAISPGKAALLRAAMGPLASHIGEKFDANRRTIDMQMSLAEKRSEKEKAKDAEAKPATEATSKALLEEDAAQRQTAQQTAENTKALVEIEKQRFQLDRKILGGGTIGAEAFSAVKVQQASRGMLPSSGGGGWKSNLIRAIEQGMAEGSFGALAINNQRNGYSPVRY
jgi:hypothetical protein